MYNRMNNSYPMMNSNMAMNPIQMNPISSAQERLMMFSNQMQQQQIGVLNGRQVASKMEVESTGVSFDGSIFIFPDYANNKIYTKHIDINGQPVVKEYVENVNPQKQEITTQQNEQVNNFVNDVNNKFNDLTQEIERLKEEIKNLTNENSKGVKTNVSKPTKQSNAIIPTSAESTTDAK